MSALNGYHYSMAVPVQLHKQHLLVSRQWRGPLDSSMSFFNAVFFVLGCFCG